MSNNEWSNAPGQPQDQGPPNQNSNTQWSQHGGAGAPSQPVQGDWPAGAQQPPVGEWNAAQGWNPGAQGPPVWNAQQQGGFAPGPQWQPQPPRPSTGFGNVFDFSFRRFALPEASGTIFLLATIAILVKWVFDLAWTLSYGPDATDLLQVVVGGLATAFLYILLVRVFLEGMSALVMRSNRDKDPGDA